MGFSWPNSSHPARLEDWCSVLCASKLTMGMFGSQDKGRSEQHWQRHEYPQWAHAVGIEHRERNFILPEIKTSKVVQHGGCRHKQ
jgi:hypothetical protein